MKNVDQIRALLRRADKLSTDENALRWEIAERVAKELTYGTSPDELAESIGKDRTFVHAYAQVWREYGGLKGQQSFNALFRLLKVTDPVERESIVAEATESGKSVATVQDKRWHFRRQGQLGANRPRPEGPDRSTGADVSRALARASEAIDEAGEHLRAMGDGGQWAAVLSEELERVIDAARLLQIELGERSTAWR